jgi:16S rRNA U1498 N3-methylase RsmE
MNMKQFQSKESVFGFLSVKPISLGKTVLRAETAALVAAYLATSEIF